MRHRDKIARMGTLLATLIVFMLGGLGVGYAAWTDQLTINGSATSGTMNVEWLSGGLNILCFDTDGAPGLAQVSATRDPVDLSLAHYTIVNAYPGYQANCLIAWTNAGTLPVKATGLFVSGSLVTSNVWTAFDLNGDTVDDVTIRFDNGVGTTTPPGSGGGKNLMIEILPGFPPGETLTFVAHVEFVLGVP